jgi:small-conductance mechanosensitive channel
MSRITRTLEETYETFLDGLDVAIPRLVTGLVFLLVAYLAVKVVLWLVGSSLRRLYSTEEQLVADLVVTVLGVFMWFGVGLAFLKIVGMGDIAVSLGTSTGFIALGVSYALSEMIEDTVAGVYLLRDPDFHVGDRISTDVASGTVAAIELRKCRIDTDDGDRIVVANRDLETKWTKEAPETDAEETG